EFDVGFLASISAQMQVTIVGGGIESFNGWGMAAAISGGEGVVGGASALFDLQGNFQGASFGLGVGAGLTPVDFYIAIQRQAATSLALAQGIPARTRSGATPLPKPRVRQPAYARSRALDAGGPDVDIKLRVFIPAPIVSAPIGYFGGDGRGFSYSAGT